MTIDKIIASPTESWVFSLFKSYDKVSSLFVDSNISFFFEYHLEAGLHTRLDFDFLANAFVNSRPAITKQVGFFVCDSLGRPVEKLFKRARAYYFQISAMSFFSSCNRFFVNIAFNFLQQLNLAALVVESNQVVVRRPKEILKYFKSVATETVSLLTTHHT